MELDDFFLLLRKAEMHETVDSEMDLTVGGVATSPSGGRREKKHIFLSIYTWCKCITAELLKSCFFRFKSKCLSG